MPITLANEEIKSFVFPGGEVQVNTKGIECATILAQIQNSDDVMKLLFTVDSLRRTGFRELNLLMPYVPYARQDRVCNPGEAHSLKVFANLINSLGFAQVTVHDPHSDVTEALFDNLTIKKNHRFVSEVVTSFFGYHGTAKKEPFYLVSPDAGAYKKITELASFLIYGCPQMEILQCGKSRDTKTGKLTGFTVGAEDLEGKTCLIVDDIIDGGGTFLGLAAELRKKNAGKLYLAATHGIFSQGFEKLSETFDKIAFTNSFKHFKQDEMPKNVDQFSYFNF